MAATFVGANEKQERGRKELWRFCFAGEQAKERAKRSGTRNTSVFDSGMVPDDSWVDDVKKLVFNPVVCVMCRANVHEPTKRVHTKDQLEYYEVDEVDPAKSVKQMFDELSRKNP